MRSGWAVPQIGAQVVTSLTVVPPGSPYTNTAVAGGIDANGRVRIAAAAPWIDVTAPSITVGVTTYALAADPTGVADVATAFTNAYAAADALGTGAIVLVPPGVYLTLTQINHPGGVLTLGSSLDYASIGPLALPARGSVITTTQALAGAVIRMGNDTTSTASGQTAPSMQSMIIDGGDVATYALRTYARRVYLRDCQIYRGVSGALDVQGQNSYVLDCVIGQDDQGIAVVVENSDCHMIGCQVRGAGSTQSCVRLTDGAATCQIMACHIFPNNSGPARELIFMFGPIGVIISGNLLDGGTLAVTVAFIRCAPNSQIPLAITITGNYFFFSHGPVTDNTIPLISLDTTTVAMGTITVTNNIGWCQAGDATHRFKSIVDFAGATALATLILTGNNIRYCVTDATGIIPAIRHSNVIYDGTNVLTPKSGWQRLDEQSTASAASLTLTVPAGNKFAMIRVYVQARSDQAGAQTLRMQLNSDTGANYDWQRMTVANTIVSVVGPTLADTSAGIGPLNASGATAGAAGIVECLILNADALNSGMRKAFKSEGGRYDADTAGGTVKDIGHGDWRNTTDAVTTIKLFGSTGNIVNARGWAEGYQ